VNRARRLRQTQSVAEEILWQRLRRNQLNGWGFRRQAPAGRFVVDFLCRKLNLVVEVDGPKHDDQEQQLFDAARTAELEQLGFLVIRVKERVVRDATDHVIDWISAVGKLIAEKEAVPQALRALNKVPLP
jgi:very-short-patch-repair endonuclease